MRDVRTLDQIAYDGLTYWARDVGAMLCFPSHVVSLDHKVEISRKLLEALGDQAGITPEAYIQKYYNEIAVLGIGLGKAVMLHQTWCRNVWEVAATVTVAGMQTAIKRGLSRYSITDAQLAELAA